MTLPISFVSVLVDFLNMPNLVHRPTSELEEKYQLYEDVMNKYQIKQMLSIIHRLEKRYSKNLKDISIPIEELMKVHRLAFRITDNLHDLVCRGVKDYKQALSIIQDYNMSKILCRKFSVPHHTNLIRFAVCDLESMINTFRDTELYNFVDQLVRLKRINMLQTQIKKGDLFDEELYKNMDLEEEYRIREWEEENGYWQSKIGADGKLMKRNQSDLMNNFFIDYVCQAFLETKGLSNEEQQLNLERIDELENEIQKQSHCWRADTIVSFEKEAFKLFRFAKKLVEK